VEVIRFYDFKDEKLFSVLKKIACHKVLSDVWFVAYCVTEGGLDYYQTFKAGLLLCPLNNRQVKAIKPIDEAFNVYFKEIKELDCG
jgi:hypothetical protein